MIMLAVMAPGRAPAAGVEHVIQISVDGLHGDLLAQMIDADDPDRPRYGHFARLVREGAAPFNARTDYTHSVTLPNHTCMLTGRPVLAVAGRPDVAHHGYVLNIVPQPDQTLHNTGSPDGRYIASVFDVAHARGRSTALYASKAKFVIYTRSYNGPGGADRIDAVVIDHTDNSARNLIDRFTRDLAERGFHYSFLHIRDPGDGRPDDTARPQPIRNGDGGNLALDLLGLPAIDRSFINAGQNLRVGR